MALPESVNPFSKSLIANGVLPDRRRIATKPRQITGELVRVRDRFGGREERGRGTIG